MENICNIVRSKLVNPIGLKNIELNFLYEKLIDGSVIIIGEGGEGGWEGVSASVIHNNKTIKPIICTDIVKYKENTFVSEMVKENKIEFFHLDFINFPEDKKYDNIVCINVLEHFGFQGMPNNLISLNHDLSGLEKMLKICNKQIILTIPYDFRILKDDHIPCGRMYTKERMELISNLCKKNNFYIDTNITFIDVNKSLNFQRIDDNSLEQILKEQPMRHEYLKCLVIKKILNMEIFDTSMLDTGEMNRACFAKLK